MKKQPKSSVARFGIGIERADYYLSKIPDKTHPLLTIKPKNRFVGTANMISSYLSQTSSKCFVIGYTDKAISCYASVGCLANVTALKAKGEVYYYLPGPFPFSKGKVAAYIAELQEIFGKDWIELHSTHTFDGKNIIGPRGEEFRLEIGGSNNIHCFIDDKAYWVPFYGINTKNSLASYYHIVKCKTTGTLHKLFWLDILRPIYCRMAGNYYCYDHSLRYTSCVIQIYFNQPVVYFKLKRLFPNIEKHHLLWLSYVISGTTITTTYYPWGNYRSGYNPKYNDLTKLRGGASINSFCSGPLLTPPHLESASVFYGNLDTMFKNFLLFTKESLSENIKLLEKLCKVKIMK